MHRLIMFTMGFLWALSGAARAASRPNFLFVYTDDQRWDAMSVVQREQGEKGRFPWIATPNMDRLAREGVRFRNAFVVNSLCAPSRATFLTGCYGYINGVVNNHTPFPVANVTYATVLRQAGYTTGFVGKWHMGKQSGQRPGFDFSASFVGQGRYNDCPFEINGKPTPTTGWVDDVSAGYAVKFLEENRAKPFVLAVAFKSPHGPCEPPARLAELYGKEEARTVPNLGIPAIYLNDPGYGTAAPTPPGLVKTNLNYHRCIHGADENLGKILDALDRLGLTDNTMVIFTSDNGYYLGEHKLGDKRSAYEESMRVPMIVRYPKLAAPKGTTIDTPVLNLDIAPTLVDFGGQPVPQRMQGRSWRPLLEGKESDWRRAFFYCYYYESNFRTPTMMAVRNESAKLVKYPGHPEWTELFDVKSDPYELKNLVKDPAQNDLRIAMEELYDVEAKQIAFQVPPYADDPAKDRAVLHREPGVVLDYHFERDAGDSLVEDRSNSHVNASVKGVPLAQGREGRKARQFDGTSCIVVPKAEAISPVSDHWTIEVVLNAQKGDGVILAHGGATAGYCLYLQGGKPAFAVNAGGRKSSAIVANSALPDGWNTITAKITPDRRMLLEVDGREVARGPLKEFIRKVPNDPLDIGADLGSQVVDSNPALPKFVGRIESVRISTE
ncbi:MAG TPA: sulfatase-like hydrolase/transferase [Tepidisphaeraceae bacterium]|nr:sulfatase-like hydrolase/transferase [Tepidisphaeraceae bacterium]